MIQGIQRTGGRYEYVQLCLTWSNGDVECTKGNPTYYDQKKCSDLKLPAGHRLHELKMWTNGRQENVAINGLKIKWSNPEGSPGLSEWSCGNFNKNSYLSEPVQNHP